MAHVERSALQSSEGRWNAGELLLVRNLGMHAVFGEKLLVCKLSVHAVLSKEVLVCHVSVGIPGRCCACVIEGNGHNDNIP